MKLTKKVLKNGLRVITVPVKESPTATVFVMVSAGAKYETMETNGISHFLEHMVFKGTPRRPKASDIARELDSLGADYNAFTGDEYTGYYAKVDKKHLDTALDIISDMYLNPLFPDEEIKKEKGVIIEEIRMYKDRPERQVGNALAELMYPGQPAGWTILGPEENIRSFDRDTFLNYRKQHYVASATTVVVAGSFNEKEVGKKIEKIFADVSAKPKKGKLKVKEAQKSPAIKVLHKDTDQTHLIIALRTFPIGDKRNVTMRALSAVLGRGMSSRLFSKMRDELGICYYVRSSHNAYTDHGFLDISAGVDTTRVELAITTILDELTRLKAELVSPAELKKAKDYVAGTMMLGLETSDAQADFVAHQEIIKKEVKTPEQMIAEMNKVTAEEIRALARKFFVNKGLNLAIIGPYKDENKFNDILKL